MLLMVERTSDARIILQETPYVSTVILRAQRGYRVRNKKYLLKRRLRLRDTNLALTWLITTMIWMARAALRVVAWLVERELKRSRVPW